VTQADNHRKVLIIKYTSREFDAIFSHSHPHNLLSGFLVQWFGAGGGFAQLRPQDIVIGVLGVRLLYRVGFLVHEDVVIEVLEVFVELVDDGHSVGHFVPFQLLFTHTVLKVLEEGAKGILVGNYQWPLSLHQLGDHLRLPEGFGPFDGVDHAFGPGEVFGSDIRVFFVMTGVSEVSEVEAGRGLGVLASPGFEILLRNGFEGLVLLQALDLAVVLLIEEPVLLVGHPVHVKLVSNGIVCPDGSFQHRTESHVELVALLLQDLASLLGLGDSQLGESHVLPPGEPVHEVVFGLAVSDKDDSVGDVLC